MHVTIGRRTAIAAVAGLGLAVALVVGASASPEPEADAPTTLAPPELGSADIARLDADSKASAAAGEPLQVYDTGSQKVVEVPQADYQDAARSATAADGYLDPAGNPRYILVWRDGQFVPGPALTCTPSDDGGPATCHVEDH